MPSSLLLVYRKWLFESEWLMASFTNTVSKQGQQCTLDRVSRLPAEMCIIRLYDSWSRFCREIILMSAACKPYTANGVQLNRSPGISKRGEAISRLLRPHTRKIFEPKWGRASECNEAAKTLAILNRVTIISALGSTNSPAEDLRVIRNYFAHRSKYAAQQIRSLNTYKSNTNLCVEELAGQITTGGITIFEDWVYNLRLVAEAAIQ